MKNKLMKRVAVYALVALIIVVLQTVSMIAQWRVESIWHPSIRQTVYFESLDRITIWQGYE